MKILTNLLISYKYIYWLKNMENNRTDPVVFYYFVTFLTWFVVVVPFLLSSVSVHTLANSAPCRPNPGGGHLV